MQGFLDLSYDFSNLLALEYLNLLRSDRLWLKLWIFLLVINNLCGWCFSFWGFILRSNLVRYHLKLCCLHRCCLIGRLKHCLKLHVWYRLSGRLKHFRLGDYGCCLGGRLKHYICGEDWFCWLLALFRLLLCWLQLCWWILRVLSCKIKISCWLLNLIHWINWVLRILLHFLLLNWRLEGWKLSLRRTKCWRLRLQNWLVEIEVWLGCLI